MTALFGPMALHGLWMLVAAVALVLLVIGLMRALFPDFSSDDESKEHDDEETAIDTTDPRDSGAHRYPGAESCAGASSFTIRRSAGDPGGSPGMNGTQTAPFQVVAFDASGVRSFGDY